METTEDILAKLHSLCEYSITISINDHRDVSDTVYERLTGMDGGRYGEERFIEEYGKDVLDGMIEKNTIIRIQFYPCSAITFYVVYDYDLHRALSESVRLAESKRKSYYGIG